MGLGAELLRRSGVRAAAALLNFLDGLPYFVLRESKLLDRYLTGVAVGELAPFWNRVLLASITIGCIFVQALVLGTIIAAGWRATHRPRT
jgi:hypothetical protein